jgi:RNA polymerase sigma-70 factor (ECF subfamily)
LTSARSVRLWRVAELESAPLPAQDRPQKTGESVTSRTEATVTSSFESFEVHAGTVYRYALRLAGRPEVAEDLTQETLLRAWQHRHALRDERAARLWLLRVAQNLWTDQLRRQKFRPETIAQELPCPRPLPADEGDKREAVALALAALDELPPRQRQVLYLVSCEDLSHEEVSNVLQIPVGAVKSNLSLARKEMRRRLRDVYEATLRGQTVTKR